MSSNSNHINSFINRENYEEYFLLLVDNELTKEEEVAVALFLAAHPDLQPEMDSLLSLKLPAEDVGFLNKDLLLAERMRINQIDESLLLYIDNELNKEDTQWLEDKISGDAQLQAQHQQLLRTKLNASDQVSYPFKKELYRHENRRKIPVYWMRVAAAILLVIGIGGLVYTTQQPASTAVVITEPPLKNSMPPVKVITPVRELVRNEEKETAKTGRPSKTGEANKATVSLAKHTSNKALVKRKDGPSYKAKSNIEPLVAEKVLDNGLANTPQQTSPKQDINNTPVTKGSVASYSNEEAPLTPAVIRDAVVRTDNEKKSSLKGLLRKATRFIERRTNISATNENDELLIGAVALKL